MKNRIELLAPGGDLDSIKAAIIAGADAVYCGLDKFNARHSAENITLDDLGGILAFAHKHDCRVFLTLNIMMVETDIRVVVGILNKLVNTSLDGVIVQDLGLFYLLSTYFPGLKIHASTQLTTHNEGQIKFLSKLVATRVNLSRELTLEEIRDLVLVGQREDVSTEVFVHGSNCVSFSGICYLSSVQTGQSGNRGRCSQPCRDRYVSTPRGENFPLNLKDNSAYFDLDDLMAAGVDAVKIEGRIKTAHYVYTVTNAYRRRLQSLYPGNAPVDESRDLFTVFNRGLSNAFLAGSIGPQAFAKHPRNQSAAQLSAGYDEAAAESAQTATDEAYDEIADLKDKTRNRINGVRMGKAPLTLRFSGKVGAPLRILVRTPDAAFEVLSETCLALQNRGSATPRLDVQFFAERLKALNETEYYIDHLELEGLQIGLFLPVSEFRGIQNRILYLLNGTREPSAAVEVPVFTNRNDARATPRLSLLIDAATDAYLCEETCADVQFQLPNSLINNWSALVALFAENERLVPWFPSILIGEDYRAARRFLHQVQPRRIVTNNTGIAHEAWKEGIPWIAGPYLNLANSLSLLSLKENLNCSGAYVSNELSQAQIRRITAPADFPLYYSIFHPALLLTSRACLFPQVAECDKETMDANCVPCEKRSLIENMKGVSSFLTKAKGEYASLYHETHVLNPEIVTDMPLKFSSFSIDLRDIQTQTKTALDKLSLARLFANYLQGNDDAGRELKGSISPVSNGQYKKGV